MRPRIYLDHAATTPILPEAREAVLEGMERWANPSSPHAEGRAARAALEDARARIAAALGWSGDVILTSGATEAIAIALKGRDPGCVAVAATEHEAVLRAAPQSLRLAVDAEGRVAEHGLDPVAEGWVVALQSANSETGVLQPLDRLGPLLAERGAILFADCSQSAGKRPLPEADLLAISAHKLGGPPGIGALLVRDLSLLAPGGGQEKGYRAGTENLPAALGFAAALEVRSDWTREAGALRARLEEAVVAAGGDVVAARAERLASIGAYRLPGVAATAQLIRLDMAGIAVSAGSACSSGSLRPSHVLTAMGWAEAAAREVVRVSFGPTTVAADVEAFLAEWTSLAAGAKARAA